MIYMYVYCGTILFLNTFNLVHILYYCNIDIITDEATKSMYWY